MNYKYTFLILLLAAHTSNAWIGKAVKAVHIAGGACQIFFSFGHVIQLMDGELQCGGCHNNNYLGIVQGIDVLFRLGTLASSRIDNNKYIKIFSNSLIIPQMFVGAYQVRYGDNPLFHKSMGTLLMADSGLRFYKACKHYQEPKKDMLEKIPSTVM